MVTVAYLLVLSRSPTYVSQGWRPQGSFSKMDMTDFRAQTSFPDDIEEFTFKLEGPGLKMRDSIKDRDVIGFEMMQRQFNKGMRIAVANSMVKHGPGAILVYEMVIEPTANVESDGEDDDDPTEYL